MGANAATKCLQVIENAEKVLAIELLNAAQAIEFREPLKPAPETAKAMAAFRETVHFMGSDEIVHDLMVRSSEFLRHYQF
jgi:histidine ammonia-lyase